MKCDIMKTGFIYIIKNKINKKVYIGQTLFTVEERFKQHIKSSKGNKSYYKIYRAMNKYGIENFYYEILEELVPENIINDREIYWIEKYNSFKNGYNSNAGGEGRSIYKNVDIDYIISELKNGKQVKELAKELDVCNSTITRTLKRNGISNPQKIQNTKIALGKSQKMVDRKQVKKLYYQGYTSKEISNIIGCDTKTVRRIKNELDLDLERPRYDYSEINNENIINDKLNGLKVKKILIKYNISYCYYYKVWKNFKAKNVNSNDYPEKE